jgi:flagellar hook-associated protein 2
MYLKEIANELKNSFLTGINKVGSTDETIGMIFADAGITTAIYSEKGKLHIDEQKLRNAISKDPDKVISLFAQKPNSIFSLYATDEQKQQRFNESGLFWRMSDLIERNLSTTGIKGALIELVGSPGDTYDTQTEYSKRISDMDKKIQDLNDRMADEENRYWEQFTAMETALSKLNSQSSWISQQFSSMSN